jgi:hypothetical protein
MFPAAVHAAAGLSVDVEEVEAEAVAPAPSLEPADDGPPVHPLKASSKLAAATSTADRFAAFSN